MAAPQPNKIRLTASFRMPWKSLRDFAEPPPPYQTLLIRQSAQTDYFFITPTKAVTLFAGIISKESLKVIPNLFSASRNDSTSF